MQNFKYIEKNLNSNLNQKGQALLFVVITMTIALALGIGLSLETINSVSNVADTDTSQRALAAAEGAAERTLTLNSTDLTALADGITQSECQSILQGEFVSGECYVRFTAEGGTSQDPIEVRSTVEVETYEVTNTANGEYSSVFQIAQNDVKEFFLEGYAHNNVVACWNGNADLYYRVYNENGDSVNNIVKCSSGNCHSSWEYGGEETASTGASMSHPEYAHCYDIDVQGGSGVVNPKGLRIRALGDSIADGTLYPTPTLPVQGYKIQTHGELVNADGIERDVTVFKSFSYSPAIFDFSFYSKDNLTQ